MRPTCRVLQVALLGLALGASLPASGAEPESRQLFDGRDLDGWEHVGPVRVYVEDRRCATKRRFYPLPLCRR